MFNKIQWLAESLYSEGTVKYYEACTLQQIKNAVCKFASMGILSQQNVVQRKSKPKVYYQLHEIYKADSDKITEFYEQVIFYLPFSSSMNLHKILAEVRKLLVSDILVADVNRPKL